MKRKMYLTLFKLVFRVTFVLFLINYNLKAQEELGVIEDRGRTWLHFRNAPLYHHLASQAYSLLDQRFDDIARINSVSDWKTKQLSIRETLLDIVGPFPEKNPLNAKILRIINKDGYRIEHIVYESQPGFYVTSSLFIPDWLKRRDKAPAVIYCSGHSAEGYRSTVYQHIIINLVKKGFIVFAFDPVGQGERIEYFDPKIGKSVIGGPTSEHSYPGAQAFLTGSSQARYMIWDGIRAVDYLFTREEVDTLRIGITGRSGGGTQSAYIAAMDERIYAAAPECYITNFTRILQSNGPADAEQNLFNGINRGIDHADFFLVRAPKPALIIATTRDYFKIQGTRDTAKEVSGIYNAYGMEDNFGMVEDDAPHESTQKNREAMYAFFQKHLNNPGNPDDIKVELLGEEEMKVTNTGQVSTSLGGETVFSLNRKEAEKLIYRLEASRIKFTNHISDVLNSSKKLSGYQDPSVFNEPVFTGRFKRDGYVVEKYFVKGEGDYIIPYLLMKPEIPNNKALIYLHHSDKSVEAFAGGEIEWFVRKGFTVLAPDLLGIGETASEGDNLLRKEWYASILIGRSIVGIRAGDVVRITRLLEKNYEINEVYGLAMNEMSPVLLHAAAFEPAIKRIAIKDIYSSIQSIVMNRFYNPEFISSTIPGTIKAYDLPDLAASLAPRRLLMVNVTDGMGNNYESISKELSIITAAYKFQNAEGQLKIIPEKSDEKLYDFFLE